jgi:hypothetical protein
MTPDLLASPQHDRRCERGGAYTGRPVPAGQHVLRFPMARPSWPFSTALACGQLSIAFRLRWPWARAQCEAYEAGDTVDPRDADAVAGTSASSLTLEELFERQVDPQLQTTESPPPSTSCGGVRISCARRKDQATPSRSSSGSARWRCKRHQIPEKRHGT